MTVTWQHRLESALHRRNPELLAHLEPGLPETRVRRMLEKHKVPGDVIPLIEIYTWKNGTLLTHAFVTTGLSFLPRLPYQMLDLELALAHFDHVKTAAKTHPELREAVGRYFPIFWNGGTGWLATDLEPSRRNRVLIVEHHSDSPFEEVHGSFSDFVEDVIRSIESGRPPVALSS